MKRIGLTIVKETELPHRDGTLEYLKAFDSINAKLGAYSRGFGKVIDAVGAERHLWEYLEWNNVAKAKEAGEHWGKMCHLHKIKVFHANMEAGTSGTAPYAYYPNPYECAEAFVKAFRAAAPTYTKLWYNGWTWASTSDRRKLHDYALMKQFDAWNPQNHGTSRAPIARYWDSKCFKYKKSLPSLLTIPMIGVGRVDSDGAVWGFWDTYKKLLRDTEVDGVDFYFGNGAGPRMLGYLPHFPSLLEAVEELRSDRRWNRHAA